MEQYELGPDVNEVIKKVDEIGKALRDETITKSFAPKAEYARLLNIATGCYMFLAPEFKKWRALKENNEVAKFCQLKSENTTKFTAAAAQPEASQFVSKERYIRDVIEGWMLAAEQAIYTLKKHLESDTKEENLS
jgi:hypothetical protein